MAQSILHAISPQLSRSVSSSRPPLGLDGAQGDRRSTTRANTLAEALEAALRHYGPHHPLVARVLARIRDNERRAGLGREPDKLVRLAFSIDNRLHEREGILADRLLWLLGEQAMHEVTFPGFGKRRVDLFFPDHRLVVEEDGGGHHFDDKRDSLLKRLCGEQGLRLLRVAGEHQMTLAYLEEQLRVLGVISK